MQNKNLFFHHPAAFRTDRLLIIAGLLHHGNATRGRRPEPIHDDVADKARGRS